jgi:hypothetical protein
MSGYTAERLVVDTGPVCIVCGWSLRRVLRVRGGSNEQGDNRVVQEDTDSLRLEGVSSHNWTACPSSD